MIKKCLSIIMIVAFLFVSAGCKNEQTSSNEANIWLIDEENKLAEFDSPYTAGYQNEDGTFTLYIFSAPVQYKVGYKKYSPIDNSIIASERENYAFENKANSIKVYFPQKLSEDFLIERKNKTISFKLRNTNSVDARLTDYLNMYGDTVQAVLYEDKNVDYVFYSTNSGIKMELVLKNKFACDSYKIDYTFSESNITPTKNEKYITFNKKEKIKATYYPSLNIDSVGTLSQNEVDCENDCISLTAKHSAEYPIKVDSSFELYEDNMPDSTVNSKGEPNSYLSNYFYTTNDTTNGITQHFIRLRINYFFKTNYKNIKSASFNIKSLDTMNNIADTDVKLREVESQWTSTGLAWDNKGKITFTINNTPTKTTNNYYSFDMTNFVQKCVFDLSSLKESYGMVLVDEKVDTRPTIFASSDNTLYPMYIKIHLKSVPDDFNVKDNINDVD